MAQELKNGLVQFGETLIIDPTTILGAALCDGKATFTVMMPNYYDSARHIQAIHTATDAFRDFQEYMKLAKPPEELISEIQNLVSAPVERSGY